MKHMNDNYQIFDEFRETGLLMFVNIFLQIFGWSIVVEYNDEQNIVKMYPKKVDYAGFSEESQDRNFEKIWKYMKNNKK